MKPQVSPVTCLRFQRDKKMLLLLQSHVERNMDYNAVSYTGTNPSSTCL